ncbi:MAG: hypothetical protein U0163_08785 [Gemmatimonadaceae bacterium]
MDATGSWDTGDEYAPPTVRLARTAAAVFDRTTPGHTRGDSRVAPSSGDCALGETLSGGRDLGLLGRHGLVERHGGNLDPIADRQGVTFCHTLPWLAARTSCTGWYTMLDHMNTSVVQ